MQGIITVEDSRTARAVAQRFIRGFGIAGLAAIASLGLANRVNATSFDLDGAPAGTILKESGTIFWMKGSITTLIEDSMS